ncbi:MAG: CASTOR/POLLUX-related putative ion channel, partial [Candidatus Humimicrobiaceae bacterium]
MAAKKVKLNIKEFLRYKFDSLMSRGTISLIGFLGIITAAFIFVFTIILWLTHLMPEKSFMEIFWISLFRTIDTGMLAEGRIGLLYFILSLIIALVSIFIISILIGLLTTGIGNKIRTLQKGRSKVLEKEHTVVLGWSETIFTIISSLIEAGKNKKICRIVIMGNKDKVEMEDAIRERIDLNRNTRIILRQGNPTNINDLKILNLPMSKSIIIIEESDSKVLKTVLAINNIDKGTRIEPYNIVSVMKKYKNVATGKIAGQGQAKFILNKKFIAELIAHTCHQPGLSIVYNELLSFEGDEIHTRSLRELSGKSFKQSLQMFEDSSIIGIISDGKVKLNPSMDTIFKAEDKIIAISANDASINIYEKRDNPGLKEDAIQSSAYKDNSLQNILILGWNDSAKIIINELYNYISMDTKITVMANLDGVEKILHDYILRDESEISKSENSEQKNTANGHDMGSVFKLRLKNSRVKKVR